MSKKNKKNSVEPEIDSLDEFDSLVKSSGNPYMDLIDPELAGNSTPVDTGSYLLNAQVSGSIYGGLPGNQISVLAGEKATGKTYILLKAIKMFLKDPAARAIIWETEWATHENDLEIRGIDTKRCKILRARTVEDVHRQMFAILEPYTKKKDNKYPLLFALDSAGMLATEDEVEQLAKKENKTDMGTKAKLLKKIFRTMAIPLGVASVPLIATNHVAIDRNSNPNPKYQRRKQVGGDGIEYASTTTLMFSKSQDKENDERVGIIITSKLDKGRKAVEGSVVDLKLSFKTGLNRYYGLMDIAADAGIVTRIGDRFKIGNGGSQYEKAMLRDPKKYYTREFLDEVDKACQEKFKYGNKDAEQETSQVTESEESEQEDNG